MNSNNANQIFVVTVKGEQLAIDFDPNDTVEVLKAKVEAAEGTPATEQYPLLSGKLLENGHTLAEYNIQKEATVHLGTPVEGGNPLAIGAVVFMGYIFYEVGRGYVETEPEDRPCSIF